jgi:hypothetical protein
MKSDLLTRSEKNLGHGIGPMQDPRMKKQRERLKT